MPGNFVRCDDCQHDYRLGMKHDCPAIEAQRVAPKTAPPSFLAARRPTDDPFAYCPRCYTDYLRGTAHNCFDAAAKPSFKSDDLDVAAFTKQLEALTHVHNKVQPTPPVPPPTPFELQVERAINVIASMRLFD